MDRVRHTKAMLAAAIVAMSCSAANDGMNEDAAETSATSATTTPGASETTTPVADSTTATPATSAGSGSGDSSTVDDSDGESGTPSDGESGVVRFVAFGDQGEGNQAQQMVADAAVMVCEQLGCDFAMLLGDNFYDDGVTAVDDPQFVTKFEIIYAGLDMPFYVVLGNHDYGQFLPDWERGQYQIDYGIANPKWVMPHFWYTFSSPSGDTQFFAFDTQRLLFNHQTDVQKDWLSQQMAASTASWRIGMAHHPYISNGSHGNAGNYEGLGFVQLGGSVVKDFFDEHICGQVDVYLSGHDHNRQAFDPVCGTYFLVTGASAKTSDFAFRDDNPTAWGDDQREGFVWAEITGNDFTARFYDLDGNLDFEQAFTRR